MLHPGVVPERGGWQATGGPAPRVVGPDLGAPVLQGKRGIGDHHVEAVEVSRSVEELGVAQGVAPPHPGVLDVVEEEVHARDGRGGELHLLAEEAHLGHRAPGLQHLGGGLDEHAARADRGVVHRVRGPRVEDLRQEADHRARGEELAGLLARRVGELPEQVLVGRTQDVVADPRGMQVERGEGADQVAQGMLGQLVLVAPLHVPEDQGERLGVGLLDALEHGLERHPDVVGDPTQVAPVTALGDLEAVVLGQRGEGLVAAVVGQGSRVLAVPGVADPLEEEQREDVGLEVSRIDRTAQGVRGRPEA